MRTGGCLNVINEKYRCNDPSRTIRISSLLRHHTPRTEEAMLALLESHRKRCFVCGEETRNGGLSGWARALQDAALADHAVVTAQQCQDFVYDLYVRAPVQGFYYEDRAVIWLQQCGYRDVRLATPAEDCAHAIDLVVCHRNRICGIQVKPESYRRVRAEVHAINAAKNSKAGMPVHYLYYEKDGTWENNGVDVLNALWLYFQPKRIY